MGGTISDHPLRRQRYTGHVGHLWPGGAWPNINYSSYSAWRLQSSALREGRAQPRGSHGGGHSAHGLGEHAPHSCCAHRCMDLAGPARSRALAVTSAFTTVDHPAGGSCRAQEQPRLTGVKSAVTFPEPAVFFFRTACTTRLCRRIDSPLPHPVRGAGSGNHFLRLPGSRAVPTRIRQTRAASPARPE